MDAISPKNTAFYSTCNDSYISNSLTSLLTIRDYIPNAHLFIISRNVSNQHKALLAKHSISLIDIDLRSDFTRHWQYPSECYYLFAGPEMLLKKGFAYSVYIDGDILCLDDPIKDVNLDATAMAGVSAGSFSNIFGEESKQLSRLFRIKTKSFNHDRIQSGVVYFNNQKMADLNFYKTAAKLFKTCLENQIPRKGDDSLLALFQLSTLGDHSYQILDKKYNYITILNNLQNIPQDLIFIHFTGQKPWSLHPYVKQRHQEYPLNQYKRIWRQKLRRADPEAWFSNLYFSQVIKYKSLGIVDSIRNIILSFNGLKYSYLTRISNSKKPSLKIFISRNKHLGILNFGDEFPIDILKHCFGYHILCTPASNCDMLTIGSILEYLQQVEIGGKIFCWGSGFISPETNLGPAIHNATFCAIRGRKTLSKIQQLIPVDSNITLGDPGILASVVYPKSKHKNHKVGVVAHFADLDTTIVRKMREDDRFILIDPLEPPQEVAKQISSCRLILSSSLHGLIFADSYKIPNIHVKFSSRLIGGKFKFKDYYSGIGKEYHIADNDKLFDNQYLNHIIETYEPINNLKKKQKSLIKVFPY